MVESETYIGGHVECLEAGVFRADIPAKFNLVPSALQQLIGNIDRDLTFTLESEHGVQVISNIQIFTFHNLFNFYFTLAFRYKQL